MSTRAVDHLGRSRIARRRESAIRSLYWLAWLLGAKRRGVRSGLAREFDRIGVDALMLVGTASFLVGVIAIFQLAYQLEPYGAESFSGRGVGWFATRELGPLIAGLVVVTRSASAIAGELAAMTMHGEVDALRVMRLDPVKYLVAPKVGALLIALPALTIIADGLVLLGGWIGSIAVLRSDPMLYVEHVRIAFDMRDMYIGLGKSVLFALVIGIFATDEGMTLDRRRGAIGDAASRAVVECLIGVLAADTILNGVFYFIPGLFR